MPLSARQKRLCMESLSLLESETAPRSILFPDLKVFYINCVRGPYFHLSSIGLLAVWPQVSPDRVRVDTRQAKLQLESHHPVHYNALSVEAVDISNRVPDGPKNPLF